MPNDEKRNKLSFEVEFRFTAEEKARQLADAEATTNVLPAVDPVCDVLVDVFNFGIDPTYT